MPADATKPGRAFGEIKHFFVLMLENRSFDHLFGWHQAFQKTRQAIAAGTHSCPVRTSRPHGAQVAVTDDTPDIEDQDPPHEFEDVHCQVVGEAAKEYDGSPQTMQGFAASGRHGPVNGESATEKARRQAARGNGEYALRCCDADSTPFLRQLAERYAVCERWHSSMPGPTWPNRFFVHAATSGGLDNSPSWYRVAQAVTVDAFGFDFEHGTIYDKLKESDWRIYHGDSFPNVFGIKKLVRRRFAYLWRSQFRGIDQFYADLQKPFEPKYVFIEPRYNVFRHHRHGTSQHPAGSLLQGDSLVKAVYESIRYSPVWENSALIVTYDEHGGFFDREPLPQAIPPGDDTRNHGEAEYPANFDFKLLGLRVPTVIVSPWINAQVDDTLYDHTSILSTLRKQFGFTALTQRDAAANDFSHLFDREKPRMDEIETPSLPPQLHSPLEHSVVDSDETSDADDNEAISPDEAGVMRIAAMMDHLMREQTVTALRKAFDPFIAPVMPDLAITPTPAVRTRKEAKEYVASVEARLGVTLNAPDEPEGQVTA